MARPMRTCVSRHVLHEHQRAHKSLQYIPFSDGKRFDLAATVQVSKSGRQLPLAECGATYDTYLNGLDENSIANLIEKANERGRYAGIRMGDIAAGDTQLSINK